MKAKPRKKKIAKEKLRIDYKIRRWTYETYFEKVSSTSIIVATFKCGHSGAGPCNFPDFSRLNSLNVALANVMIFQTFLPF